MNDFLFCIRLRKGNIGMKSNQNETGSNRYHDSY